MKNALLVLLLLILPWQVITAAERNFTHVVGSVQGADFVRHYTEHVQQVMHHHHDDDGSDDDGGSSHDDDPAQSSRHLADVDHGFSLNFLLPLPHDIAFLPAARIVPAVGAETFRSLTTYPPRRPPRTLA